MRSQLDAISLDEPVLAQWRNVDALHHSLHDRAFPLRNRLAWQREKTTTEGLSGVQDGLTEPATSI